MLNRLQSGKSGRLGEKRRRKTRGSNALAFMQTTGGAPIFVDTFGLLHSGFSPWPHRIAEPPRCCTFGRDLITMKASLPPVDEKGSALYLDGTRCVAVRIIPYPFNRFVNFVHRITRRNGIRTLDRYLTKTIPYTQFSLFV